MSFTKQAEKKSEENENVNEGKTKAIGNLVGSIRWLKIYFFFFDFNLEQLFYLEWWRFNHCVPVNICHCRSILLSTHAFHSTFHFNLIHLHFLSIIQSRPQHQFHIFFVPSLLSIIHLIALASFFFRFRVNFADFHLCRVNTLKYKKKTDELKVWIFNTLEFKEWSRE